MIKKITIPILKIFISAGLIFFLFYKLGFNNVVTQITSVNLYWFLLSILIFTLSNILGSIQWYLLLKIKGINLSLSKIVSFYYVGLFFNNLLVGYIGGDAIRIYDVSKSTGNSSDTISAVFFDRFIGFAVLTTMALVAALYRINLFSSYAVLIAIIIIFSYWVILFILFFNEKIIKKLSWLIRLILPPKIKLKVKEIYLGINTFKHHKKALLKIIIISVVIQNLRILVHFTSAHSIGVKINIIYFIIFIPVIALLASLPISIGGIGVRESSGIALFSQIWNSHADIVAFEFLAFLIGIISTIPGGIIFMLRKEVNQPTTNGEVIK